MQVSMTVNPSSMFTEFCGVTGKKNVLVAGSEKIGNSKQKADLVTKTCTLMIG